MDWWETPIRADSANVAVPRHIDISLQPSTPPYQYKASVSSSKLQDGEDPIDHSRQCLSFRARLSSRGEDEFYRSKSSMLRRTNEDGHLHNSERQIHVDASEASIPKYPPLWSPISPRMESRRPYRPTEDAHVPPRSPDRRPSLHHSPVSSLHHSPVSPRMDSRRPYRPAEEVHVPPPRSPERRPSLHHSITGSTSASPSRSHQSVQRSSSSQQGSPPRSGYQSPKPLNDRPANVGLSSSPRHADWFAQQSPSKRQESDKYRPRTSKSTAGPHDLYQCLPHAPLSVDENVDAPSPTTAPPTLWDEGRCNSSRFRDFLQVCKSVTQAAQTSNNLDDSTPQNQRSTSGSSGVPSMMESEHSDSTGYVIYDMARTEQNSSYAFDDTTRDDSYSTPDNQRRRQSAASPARVAQRQRRPSPQPVECAQISQPPKRTPQEPLLLRTPKARGKPRVVQRGALSAADVVTVEVAPGEFVHVRRALETREAIQRGFYKACTCICCNQGIYVIRDADFVLCPDCRVASPTIDPEECDIVSGTSGGVGLGFKL
jgi:hypothetical protein